MIDSILSQASDGVSVSIGTGSIGLVLGFVTKIILDKTAAKGKGDQSAKRTTCPVHASLQKEITETKEDMKHVHRRIDEMIQGQANNTQAILQAINGLKK